MEQDVEIVLESANPELYRVTLFGDTIGRGSFQEMRRLAAQYDPEYQPRRRWDDPNPAEWIEHRRSARRALYHLREQHEEDGRMQAARRRAYFDSAPRRQPVRPVTVNLKLVKSEDGS